MTGARREAGLDRRRAVAELLRDRGDLLVVCGLGTPSYDVFAAGDHPANMYLWGAMGGSAMVGLGLALAQKRRPVTVITGDGEQLMGLGALATIAAKKPGNLTIIVLDNRRFGETGNQASHTGLGVELHLMAAAAGFAHAVALGKLAEVKAYRLRLREINDGPRFATLRISPSLPPRVLPPRDGVFLKNRFRATLGIQAN